MSERVLYVRLCADVDDYVRRVAAEADLKLAPAIDALLRRAMEEGWSLARRSKATVVTKGDLL
jgi:hypothetical protein